MIRIHREDIVAAEACAMGIEWFDKHFPSGRAEFKTSKDLLLFACANSGAEYTEWWMRKTRITHNLSEADLRGAYLRGAGLDYANLRDAKLQNADLRQAILCGSILRYAKLEGAILWEADLRYADLRYADLTGANLTDTVLTGALRSDTDPPIPGWVVNEGKLVRK